MPAFKYTVYISQEYSSIYKVILDKFYSDNVLFTLLLTLLILKLRCYSEIPNFCWTEFDRKQSREKLFVML